MRLLSLILFIFPFSAHSTLKLISTTGTTGEDGTVTIAVKIPGTFTTVDRTASAFSGRIIDHADLFWGTPVAGDRCSNMRVTDDDGKIPAPVRALFPSYPLIKTRDDVGDSNLNGIYTRPGAMTVFTPPAKDGTIPSELWLKLDCTKAALAVGESVFINMYWDDGL